MACRALTKESSLGDIGDLENDVPVWIADFALRLLQRDRARADERNER